VQAAGCGEAAQFGVHRRAGVLAEELRHLVRDRRRNLVRLTPPVYGEVVRARLGPIRARTAYRVLLAWLSDTPRRRRDDLLRLASWQLAAGDSPDPAILLPPPVRRLSTTTSTSPSGWPAPR
jgi:hypothetical protein